MTDHTNDNFEFSLPPTSHARSVGGGPTPEDLMDLAAWLDAADEKQLEHDSVEGRLAAHHDLRTIAGTMRASDGPSNAAIDPVSDDVVMRATALVGASPFTTSSPFVLTFLRPLAAAACVGVAVLGFRLGTQAGELPAASAMVVAGDPGVDGNDDSGDGSNDVIVQAASFGLLDDDASDDDAWLGFAALGSQNAGLGGGS